MQAKPPPPPPPPPPPREDATPSELPVISEEPTPTLGAAESGAYDADKSGDSPPTAASQQSPTIQTVTAQEGGDQFPGDTPSKGTVASELSADQDDETFQVD